MKRTIAFILMFAMIMALSVSGTAYAANNVTLTIFNSKMEIQSQMEEMAEEYMDTHKNVEVEVYYSSDTVAAHMSTKYASKDPYVLAMVDAVDGKVLGFPFCVEARGILYNADAIEAITGEAFDPAAYKTTADFQALCDKLVAGGMEGPTGLQKEDWSLGAHFMQEIYEMQDDPDAFIAGIKDGSVKLAEDPVFNAMMDTFDVLKAYNWMKAAPLSAVREDTEMNLAQGNIAFKFGGNWDWSDIKDFDPAENMGMMPVPSDLDGYNEKLVGGGSKYFFIDNSVSAEQQEAAKQFLNWLVYDEAGQDFLVNTCALVPAFSNIELEVADQLGQSVKAFADADMLTPSYNYMPDDHYAKLGQSMQSYLADEIDRAGLAQAVVDYWKSTTPVEH